jgi:hypothetical protein
MGQPPGYCSAIVYIDRAGQLCLCPGLRAGAAEQRVSIEFTSNSGDATVDDMMYHFKKFLQACDYCFHLNDIIEVVSEFKESQDQVKDMLHD